MLAKRMLPVTLVFVRHAESVGNRANGRSWHGDQSAWSPEFRSIRQEHWRIVPEGRMATRAAGEFIRSRIQRSFTAYRVSPLVRTMETAGWLCFPKADWRIDPLLTERDWGMFAKMSPAEVRAQYAPELAAQDGNEFGWVPPGGESIEAIARTRGVALLESLNRVWEVSDPSVCCVSHNNTMWAIDALLRGLTGEEFSRAMKSGDPLDGMQNLRVLVYTRRNPESGLLEPVFCWTAQFYPLDLSRSPNTWREIRRPFEPKSLVVRPESGRLWSNNELIAEGARYPLPELTT